MKKRTPEHQSKINAALRGRHPNAETRIKLSIAHKKYYENPEAREKTSKAGKKYYSLPGMRERQSEILKKAFTSPEARKIKSEAAKKCNANLEKRKKHSETIKRYYEDPEYRIKMGECVKNGLARAEVREKMSGSNNPRWRGGIHTPYGPGFNNDLRCIIRKRDDYLCQNPRCYLPENGRKHAIHHIDFNKWNNRPVNLITTCARCHIKTGYGDRDYWMEYYKNLQDMRGIV